MYPFVLAASCTVNSFNASNGCVAAYHAGQKNHKINSQNGEVRNVTAKKYENVKLCSVTVLSCVCHVSCGCHVSCVSCVTCVMCHAVSYACVVMCLCVVVMCFGVVCQLLFATALHNTANHNMTHNPTCGVRVVCVVCSGRVCCTPTHLSKHTQP